MWCWNLVVVGIWKAQGGPSATSIKWDFKATGSQEGVGSCRHGRPRIEIRESPTSNLDVVSVPFLKPFLSGLAIGRAEVDSDPPDAQPSNSQCRASDSIEWIEYDHSCLHTVQPDTPFGQFNRKHARVKFLR